MTSLPPLDCQLVLELECLKLVDEGLESLPSCRGSVGDGAVKVVVVERLDRMRLLQPEADVLVQ
jgi:hypothetical protein